MLGSLEVVGADGPLELPGAKERAVLAYLLANLGRSVSPDEIVDAVWGERAPASAARSLHVRISHLRRALEPERAAASTSVIARDGAGYQLLIDDADVDAGRFEHLVAGARDAGPRESLAQANQALALVRGEPYGEFVYLDFAQAEIRRLKELELQAQELRGAALLALGREDEALPELERLVEQNPLREPLARNLMLALYRRGRQEDALAAFRQLSERLRALGLEPDEDSRRLERQMLQRAPGLARIEPLRTNIGARLTSFVGREADRADLLARLAEHRLVTLTGPGGVGKTSLAAEVARTLTPEYADGVWLIELAPQREPVRVAEVVVEALGMRTSELEGRVVSPLVFLQSHLRRRELLLVLDNCEHLAAAAGELALSLLAACPGVRVLATSRERLAVPGEAVFELEPLGLPGRGAATDELGESAAVRLFVERARTVRGDLEPDAKALRAIGEICRRLDGLPLALELAAARTRTLSLEEIATRLADRFALLGRGPERLSERQRTLAGVVEWSYQLLDEREQSLFRRISVFPSSFGLEAAEEVCAGGDIDAAEVADLLASLVDRSVVAAASGGPDRFRLLETLREFGRAQAEALDERVELRAQARRLGRSDRRGRPRTCVDPRPRGRDALVRAETRGLRSGGRLRLRGARRRSGTGARLRARNARLPLHLRRGRSRAGRGCARRSPEEPSSADCAACARWPSS